jgi:hypothetical protein
VNSIPSERSVCWNYVMQSRTTTVIHYPLENISLHVVKKPVFCLRFLQLFSIIYLFTFLFNILRFCEDSNIKTHINPLMCSWHVTAYNKQACFFLVFLDCLVASVLAIGRKVRGFKPGLWRCIFKGDNNL